MAIPFDIFIFSFIFPHTQFCHKFINTHSILISIIYNNNINIAKFHSPVANNNSFYFYRSSWISWIILEYYPSAYQSWLSYEIKNTEYLTTSFLALLIFSMHVTVNQPTLWKLCLRSRGTVKNRFAEASRYFRSLNVLYLVCITQASRGVELSAELGDRGAHEYHRWLRIVSAAGISGAALLSLINIVLHGERRQSVCRLSLPTPFVPDAATLLSPPFILFTALIMRTLLFVSWSSNR